MLFAVVVIAAVAIVPIVLKFLYLDGIFALDLRHRPLAGPRDPRGARLRRDLPLGALAQEPELALDLVGIRRSRRLLWLIGSALFSVYVSRFGSYDATYGALGAVVVLLLWLWVSALVLLVGAEIDAELDQRATATGSPLAGVPAGAAKKP